MEILSWKNQTKERYVALAWNTPIRSFDNWKEALAWSRYWVPEHGDWSVYDMELQMTIWCWML